MGSLSVRKNSISQNQHGDYNKCLRYYPDYCGKYNHSHSDPASLSFFDNKLKGKNQNEFQSNQAKDTVRLYYALANVKSLYDWQKLLTDYFRHTALFAF